MQRGRSRWIGIGVVLLALAGIVVAQPCQPVPSRADVDAVLQYWNERTAPRLDPAERARLERRAADAPTSAAPGVPTISFEEDGVDVRPVASRRDWAYALEGFHATLVGGTREGAADLLDLGLWAFVQAARLQPEADHLANVAFHLNDRRAFEDAIVLLCFARDREPLHASVRANLAFALAELGDLEGAVAEQAGALALRPGEARAARRLEAYAAQAGIELDVANALSPAGSSATEAPFAAFPAPDGTSGSLALYDAYGEIFGETVMFLQRRSGAMGPEPSTTHLGFVADQRAVDEVFVAALNASELEAARCYERCPPAGYPDAGCTCTCTVAKLQREWQAVMQSFFDVAPLLERYERAELRELFVSRDRMLAILERYRAELRPDEVRALQRAIYDWYLDMATLRRFDPWHADLAGRLQSAAELRRTLEQTQQECARAARESLPAFDPADLFGRRPRTLVLRELNPASAEVWHIWFGFGSLDLHPDDSAVLSLGVRGVLNARFRYNFRTHAFGSGVGIGLNLGKALGPLGGVVFKNSLKFEFFAEVDSERGPSAGLETGLNPRVGVLHSDQEVVLRLEN